MDREALLLTLELAAATTLLLVSVAVPLAWWITSGTGLVRSTVQGLVALPIVLPPTVLGFYLLVGLGPTTWPGRLVIRLFGHPLAFSFSGLLVGSVIYSLPFAVQPLISGFRAVDRELLEAASLLGARPLARLIDITLPLSLPALLSATVLVFTHTVGEFGVVLMLGGNIPGSTRTLSISLYNLVEEGRYAEANQTALLLVGFALAGLILLYTRATPRSEVRSPLD